MIEAKGLTMYYGDFLAVDNASFSIGTGEVIGLLGPNGAGKTTIMKMLTTYLFPSSGTALVGDNDITSDPLKVREIIGYLPESLPLYPGMEVADYLKFVGAARGLKGERLKERIDWVRDRCGLTRVFRKPISDLSKGYKQRTGLAQALIHDPKIVILDEPTSGLDPHQIIEIRNLIEELAAERTMIISTHILQEMAALTDRFIIIDRGKIVANGPLEELRDSVMPGKRIMFAVDGDNNDVETALKKVDGVKTVTRKGKDGATGFEIICGKDIHMIDALNKLTVDKGWKLLELNEVPYSLEETVLALTKSEAEIVAAPKAENKDKEGDA